MWQRKDSVFTVYPFQVKLSGWKRYPFLDQYSYSLDNPLSQDFVLHFMSLLNSLTLSWFSKASCLYNNSRGAARRRMLGVATPALLYGKSDCICALLVTAYCPNFLQPHRSISLKMIKIALMVPGYYNLTTVLQHSWFCPCIDLSWTIFWFLIWKILL